MQVAATGDRSDLPGREEPGHTGGAQAVAHGEHVVVGAAEQCGTPAGAREQERTGHPGRHLVQHGLQVGVGTLGVTHLQLHGLADPDGVPDHETAALGVGADDATHQEVAETVLVGVLVHGDTELKAARHHRLLLRRQCCEHLLDLLDGRLAGEAEHDVALGGRHGHRRAHRPAALAHHGPVGQVAAQYQPDSTPVVDHTVDEQPGRARSTQPGRVAATDRQPGQDVVGLLDERVDRERVRVHEEHRRAVVRPAGRHPDHGDRLRGTQHLEVERPQVHAGQPGQPDTHRRRQLDAAPTADHPRGTAAEDRRRAGELAGAFQRSLDVVRLRTAHEDEREVRRHSVESGEGVSGRVFRSPHEIRVDRDAVAAAHPGARHDAHPCAAQCPWETGGTRRTVDGVTDRPTATTLGELRASGHHHRPVKTEIRENLLDLLRSGQPRFAGIVGFDETVLPALERALLAGHDVVLLGERGQGKTRLIRTLVTLLDEWTPVVDGCEINDHPVVPVCARCRRLHGELGDDLPVGWQHRSERYGEKLATPDTSVGDLIGDIDPVKVAEGRTLGDPETVHFGLVPRTNRGIFAINELPDLAERIQVSLLNVLEERDIQVRGYALRLPLDVLLVATANPEDYTNRGRIITPLKDRFGAEIRTHYPDLLEDEIGVIRQEADLAAIVPDFLLEVVARFTRNVRESPAVDARSGCLRAVRRGGDRDRSSVGTAPLGTHRRAAGGGAGVRPAGRGAQPAGQGGVRGRRGRPRGRGACPPAPQGDRRDVPAAPRCLRPQVADRALRRGPGGRQR